MSESVSKANVLLINMDKSVERLAKSTAELAKFALEFTRISAVDGREFTQEQIDAQVAEAFSGYYKVLTAGELGCYLSHKKCWQHIVDNKLDYAIILEDDFVLQEDLSSLPNYLANIEQDWDCIKLMEYPEKRKAIQSFTCLDKTLIRYDKIPSRTCAYVISKQGAMKMLKHSQKVARPIDIDFQYWWETGVQVLGLKPYMVAVNHEEESTIDSGKHRKSIRKSVVKQYLHKWYFSRNNKKHLNILLNK